MYLKYNRIEGFELVVSKYLVVSFNICIINFIYIKI